MVLDLLVILVQLDQKELQDLQEQKVIEDHKVLLDLLMVLLDLKVLLVQLLILVHQDRLV